MNVIYSSQYPFAFETEFTSNVYMMSTFITSNDDSNSSKMHNSIEILEFTRYTHHCLIHNQHCLVYLRSLYTFSPLHSQPHCLPNPKDIQFLCWVHHGRVCGG